MKKKRMYVRYNEQEKNKNRKKTYKWFFFCSTAATFSILK